MIGAQADPPKHRIRSDRCTGGREPSPDGYQHACAFDVRFSVGPEDEASLEQLQLAAGNPDVSEEDEDEVDEDLEAECGPPPNFKWKPRALMPPPDIEPVPIFR
eukprot:1195776-Prorocentrum_minimum.AAC.6